MGEAIREKGVREALVGRVEEMVRESKNRVKMRKWYWTTRRVRQRCPLSPLLFSVLMTDIEKEMKKGDRNE